MVKITGQKTSGGSPVAGFPSWLPAWGLSASKEGVYFPCRAGERAAVSLRVHTHSLCSEAEPLIKVLVRWAGSWGRVCLHVQGPSHLPGREKFISISACISPWAVTPLLWGWNPLQTGLRKMEFIGSLGWRCGNILVSGAVWSSIVTTQFLAISWLCFAKCWLPGQLQVLVIFLTEMPAEKVLFPLLPQWRSFCIWPVLVGSLTWF